uniref:Uncharacterized protein n=1 Tax=Haptolina ericina TaxID=156174 RepID=A0A7S3EY90_9EUKA|mmetsp:Transcript_35921/g.81511  ORF Transcript_35921/g.81511 Transcript_35921/m.81511 type:complete len:235 (+) Transcript_35921:136-840(+)
MQNATLIIAGHLRNSCAAPAELEKHVMLCRGVMLECRVVLVTYSVIDGPDSRRRNNSEPKPSSWSCIEHLVSTLNISSTVVLSPPDTRHESPIIWPHSSGRISSYKSMTNSILIGSRFAHATDTVVRIRPDASKWLGALRKQRQWEAAASVKADRLYRCPSHMLVQRTGTMARGGVLNSDACFVGKAPVFRRFVDYWHSNLESIAQDPNAHYHQEWSMDVVSDRLKVRFVDQLQ